MNRLLFDDDVTDLERSLACDALPASRHLAGPADDLDVAEEWVDGDAGGDWARWS